jgi:cytidylate kinase
VPLAAVRSQLAARDAQDSGRATAPLRVADDAVYVDTTGRSVEEIVLQVIALARERGA